MESEDPEWKCGGVLRRVSDIREKRRWRRKEAGEKKWQMAEEGWECTHSYRVVL